MLCETRTVVGRRSTIIAVRNSSCGKVMFLHLSVILFGGACVAGGCAWGHAWQDGVRGGGGGRGAW